MSDIASNTTSLSGVGDIEENSQSQQLVDNLESVSLVEEVISEENLDVLTSELKKCEYYFISWLRDDSFQIKPQEKVNSGDEKSLLERLKIDNNNKSAEVKSSGDNSKKSEPSSPEVSDFSENDSDSSEEGSKWESEEDDPNPFSSIEKTETLEMQTLQRACNPLLRAFLHLRKDADLEAVKKFILWNEKFCDHCVSKEIFSEEYANGFQFLRRLLTVHLHIKEGNAKKTTEDLMMSAVFDELKPKGQSMVWLAKWMLNEMYVTRKKESVHNLLQVRRLDPDNWVWNYLLCSRLRFQRRAEGGGLTSPPDPMELEAIVNAVRLTTTDTTLSKHKPMCVAGLCQALAETVRSRIHERRQNDHLDIGLMSFDNANAVIEYIKIEATAALENPTCCFGEFIRYGEMFSTILPYNERKYELAERCYFACIQIMPENSKAHHRMGILQLVGKEDTKNAIKALKVAVKLEPKNYPAWVDLIQTLLSSFEENSEDINKCFETIKGGLWTVQQLSQFHFLRGSFAFLLGNTDEAIAHWLKMKVSDTSEKSNSFDFLHGIQKRYRWARPTVMTLENISTVIQKKVDDLSSTNDGDKETDCDPKEIERLRLLVKIVENAKIKDENFRRARHVSQGDGHANFQKIGGGRVRSSLSEADADSCWRNPGNTNTVQESTSPSNSAFAFRRRNDDWGNGNSAAGGSNARGVWGPGENVSGQRWGNNARGGNFQKWENGSDSRGGQQWGGGGGRNWNDRRQGYGVRANRSPSPDSWR